MKVLSVNDVVFRMQLWNQIFRMLCRVTPMFHSLVSPAFKLHLPVGIYKHLASATPMDLVGLTGTGLSHKSEPRTLPEPKGENSVIQWVDYFLQFSAKETGFNASNYIPTPNSFFKHECVYIILFSVTPRGDYVPANELVLDFNEIVRSEIMHVLNHITSGLFKITYQMKSNVLCWNTYRHTYIKSRTHIQYRPCVANNTFAPKSVCLTGTQPLSAPSALHHRFFNQWFCNY